MSRTEQTNGNENEILSVMIEGKIDKIRVVGFSSQKKKEKTKSEKGTYNVKNKRQNERHCKKGEWAM